MEQVLDLNENKKQVLNQDEYDSSIFSYIPKIKKEVLEQIYLEEYRKIIREKIQEEIAKSSVYTKKLTDYL